MNNMYGGSGSLALINRIKELETKNTELEAQVESLNSKSNWKNAGSGVGTNEVLLPENFSELSITIAYAPANMYCKTRILEGEIISENMGIRLGCPRVCSATIAVSHTNVQIVNFIIETSGADVTSSAEINVLYR